MPTSRDGPSSSVAVSPQPPFGRLFQAGDQPQQRRLSAAGRADDGHETAALDREIDGPQRPHGLLAAAENLGDARKLDGGRRELAPRATRVRPGCRRDDCGRTLSLHSTNPGTNMSFGSTGCFMGYDLAMMSIVRWMRAWSITPIWRPGHYRKLLHQLCLALADLGRNLFVIFVHDLAGFGRIGEGIAHAL